MGVQPWRSKQREVDQFQSMQVTNRHTDFVVAMSVERPHAHALGMAFVAHDFAARNGARYGEMSVGEGN